MPDRRPPRAHLALKTLNRLRRRGPQELGRLWMARASEAISSDLRLVMFVRAAGEPSDEGGPGHASYLEFREAGPSDARLYARDIGTDSPMTFRARLSGTTRCYLVLNQGRVVHGTWVTTSAAWTREIAGYICPPPGDAYLYESFTRADARGMGVYPFAMRSIADRLEREGLERIWVAVESDNAPSLRAVAKAGFEAAFEIPIRRKWGRVEVGAPTGERSELASGLVGCDPRRPEIRADKKENDGH